MLWGMGITLTKEEDELLQPIKYSCFAALGLNNDYYSFDREMEESKDLDFAPVNSVHLHLVWHNVNVEAAKVMVKDVICHYEEEFLDCCETFRRTHAPISRKLDQYLKALSYMVIGNNVWSINCPRYHKAFRYNADDMEEKIMKQDLAILEKHGLKPLARTFSSP